MNPYTDRRLRVRAIQLALRFDIDFDIALLVVKRVAELRERLV